MTLGGAVTVGGCVSWTVTANEQLAAPAVQVTLVVPTAKNEPGDGVQDGVQVPSTVGSG
jgi:hypothetical protein